MSHPEDIFVWPDNSWAFRYEIVDMPVIPDGYSILFCDSDEYEEFFVSLI